MSKIRVLHLYSRMAGGGVETFIVSMASALQDACESHLFSFAAARTYEWPDFPHTEDCEPIGSAQSAARLWNHVRSWQPHVMHVHFPLAALHGALLKALSRDSFRLVTHWHALRAVPVSSPLRAWLLRVALSRANALIACSQAAAETHGMHSGIDSRGVHILYNPVDLGAFSNADPDTAFRAAAGAEASEVLGLFLGRLSVQVKGLDILCEAVRLLPDEVPIRVAMVGPGDHHALREELQPPPRVTIGAPVERVEVPAVLTACDFLLQPSRTEGFPLTIVEAMAAGLPVIASRVGGIPEAVVDGVTGILVPPQDPQALSEAIQWMVEHPAERAEMGRRGRERAMLFDVHTIAAQLEQIYREVLDG